MSELISKWHMHRLGLVDFWYYVNEEFSFKDGHMLLRGSNGSGKSVTMQSFIPPVSYTHLVSKALAASDRRAKTDQGQHYHIEKEREGDCILHCEDGNLVMPCFKILFDEEQL